ncbi:MAG: DUF5693 family protein [Candidatus Velthaea sp.]
MTYRRILLVLLALGLLASAYVGIRRAKHEHDARRVEIVMDDADFSDLARSYNYDQGQFLVALRRAGLTSLAVAEELGGNVASSAGGAAYPGSVLLDQARLGALSDPLFARLGKANGLRADEVYLIAYDAATAARYRVQLALKFSPHSVRVLRAALPTVFAIRTQADYFTTIGLGLPFDRIALAKRFGLLLVPRLQNDERFAAPQIDALLGDTIAGSRARTVIFFGLRNQVLGFPDNVPAAADALARLKLNFGTIETYDPKQIQAGNEDLARLLAGHIVRVEAISKIEQDKLAPAVIIERYLLGVRERNIRVVYLRPFDHEWEGRSIEATNVEIVKRIAGRLKAEGFRLGGASAIYPFVVQPWLIALASLAVPGIVLWVLALIGVEDRRLLVAAVLLDLLLVAGGYLVHHDMLARKALALIAGIVFPTAGVLVLGPAFSGTFRSPRAAILEGLRLLILALAVTLAGALVIVGLLSTPLTMAEVDHFTGVKLVLLLPPVLALALYLFTPAFGAQLDDPAGAANAPVRIYQLAGGLVLVVAAYFVLIRSGNQSDIAPSTFELALRAHLTSILSVRPRFKEFLAGFPAVFLVPGLWPADRRALGWLLVLAIGMGLGDVIDTFSHLHTPLSISLLRLVNGAVLGAILGAIVVWLYRRVRWPRVS